jgi:hypothetical protein
VKPRHSNFENRLQLKQNPLFSSRRGVTPEKKRTEPAKEETPQFTNITNNQNIVIIPSSTEQIEKADV